MILAAFVSEPLVERGPPPLYLRLQERIRRAIERGELKPSEALPGERDIAQAVQVSRVTVRKALSGLVDAGLLEARQGSGTFVARRSIELPLSRLTSFTEDMCLRGVSTTSRWLLREVTFPSPRETMYLALSLRDKVVRLRRVRLAGEMPMAIELAVVPHCHLPAPDRVTTSLYAALDEYGIRPVKALQLLSAAKIGKADAALLEVEPGAAMLTIERISYLASGRPMEFTRSFYRGDTYDFVAELNLEPT